MRTIYLQEALTGWQVIVSAGINNSLVAGKSYENIANAIQGFILEGRYQPMACLVLRQLNKKLVTIKAGGVVSVDGPAEQAMIAKIREALKA